MDKSTFGKRLGKIMQQKGVSRGALKDSTGLSLQSISNYLKDKRKPDCEMVAEIAKALNVSADYLLGLSEVSTRNETVQGVHDLTGLSQKAIIKLKTAKIFGDIRISDFVSFLIENEDFENLTKEIEKLSAFHCTTIDATLGIGSDLYNIDFEAAFKLIVTDIFWEITRSYRNPFKFAEINHPITI